MILRRLRFQVLLPCILLTVVPAAAAADFGSCVASVPGDADGDGFTLATGDCNDGNPAQYPGANETCDGFDNDCDGDLDALIACRPVCDALEPTSAPQIVGAGNDSDRLALIWTGETYVAFWKTGTGPIRYAVVKPGSSGEPEREFDYGSQIQVVWTGSQIGVLLWGSGELRFTRLDAQGDPLQDPVVLGPASKAALTWNGAEFGVAWTTTLVGARFRRIDAGGSVVGLSTYVGDHPDGEVGLAASNVGFGILVVDAEGNLLFYGLSPTGNVLSGPVQLNASNVANVKLRLLWTGTEYGAFDARTGSSTRFRRVSSDGVPLGDPRSMGTGLASVTWSGRDYLVTQGGTVLARYDREGRAFGDIQSLAPTAQLAAWNGSGYGLLFESDQPTPQIALMEIACGCTDGDGDGTDDCFDCDDGNAAVYPGAPQLCDGLNNDCGDAAWPGPPTNAEDVDDDGDGLSECDGDCDDTRAVVYPGAPEVCDGVNNDCDAADWPDVATTDRDDDGDGVPVCLDCDDADAEIFPGAAQICDGRNNDCNDPSWPAIPEDEKDGDADGAAVCGGDCDDANPDRSPCAVETCNGVDDDCDILVDEDAVGEDADGDGTRGLCDNCPSFFNPDQSDVDTDTLGDVCDNCPFEANPNQGDDDGDMIGNICDGCLGDPINDPDDDDVCHLVDNCPEHANADQADSDGDGVGDVCDPCPFAELDDSDGDGFCDDDDNCPADFNELQLNDDGDSFGNLCDNCPTAANDDQLDFDIDGSGDACDPCTDFDGDGFGNPGFPRNTCSADNCPFTFNDTQSDGDGDAFGDLCDNCVTVANASQVDVDTDGHGDACDNCPETANPQQEETDGDRIGNVCDVCPELANPAQTDSDADGEGDPCDADDGLIYLLFASAPGLYWENEEPFFAWNVYRGELATLLATGEYTQLPGTNPQAARACGLINAEFTDTVPMEPGTLAYFLAAGRLAAGEGDLGVDSNDVPRANTNPCP